MTLKEILQERKRTAQAQQEPQTSHTDNQAVAVEISYVPLEICPELTAFHALFDGCEDF